MDELHGAEDDVVDGANSQKSHEAFLKRGVKGTFQLLEAEGHKISRGVAEQVKKLLLLI